jgi:sirohydrochlorin cobaltochelatase
MTQSTQRALVLFAHGARAPGWAEPFERLRDQTRARLPGVAVSLAFLELMEPRLPAEVAALAASGVQDVTIVPVFLGVGGHLLRDLPALVTQLQLEHPAMRVTVAGAVGEDSGVLAAMTAYCVGALQ